MGSHRKVAELVGVSRQAVTKWEANQTAPSTENLFKLAEIFGTSVDLLLQSDDPAKQTPAEQVYYLYKMAQERNAESRRARRRRDILTALVIALAYLVIYLIGRFLWCGLSESSFLGWLVLNRPTGEHSYLYGWLLSSSLFWYAMALSVVPALLGKRCFSLTVLAAAASGIPLGEFLGENPGGAAYGQGHYGWAIWCGMLLLSIVLGVVLERLAKKGLSMNSRAMRIWCATALVGIIAIIAAVRLAIPVYPQ